MIKIRATSGNMSTELLESFKLFYEAIILKKWESTLSRLRSEDEK